MANPLIIILVLIIAPMVLGALLKMFKAYQEEIDRQNQRKKPRTAVPTVPASSSAAATGRGSGEIDRFLAEIDKLRQKAESPVKAAPVKVVPVAKVVAPKVEPAPFVVPTAFTTPRVTQPEAPIARAVPPAPPPRPAAPGGAAAAKAAARGTPIPGTPFGKNLTALLSSKQSLPMAVVLHEVLGPPKARRR